MKGRHGENPIRALNAWAHLARFAKAMLLSINVIKAYDSKNGLLIYAFGINEYALMRQFQRVVAEAAAVLSLINALAIVCA